MPGMKTVEISDIDNAKNKRQFITNLLTDKLKDRPVNEIVGALTAFMSADDLEDAVASICGIER